MGIEGCRGFCRFMHKKTKSQDILASAALSLNLTIRSSICLFNEPSKIIEVKY